jgi:hypothetical protein
VTPVQEALIALGDHCVRCPTCKPEWQGDTPVHRPCPAADQLYQQWRQYSRSEVRAA